MEIKMTKEQYILKKITELKQIIDDEKLKNYFYQLNALKLGAQLKKTYIESYLWRNALILSSSSCKILLEEFNATANTAMHYAAQIYELLSIVSEDYDKEYCRLLSAFCYDISGYQANALCLIKTLYLFEETEYKVEKENFLLKLLQLFSLRKLYQINEEVLNVNNVGEYEETDISLANIFKNISNFFLAYSDYSIESINQFDSEVLNAIRKIYCIFLDNGNVTMSHLLFLFLAKYNKLKERSIIHNLSKFDKLNNLQWLRYAKVLSRNLYNKNRIINKESRISTIEYWKSQLNAIESGVITNNENYVIQMPTSAGKTFVAEMIILNNLIENPGCKCIYIAPFKALVSQVEEALAEHLGKIGYNVSTIVGNYEIDTFDNLIIDEADVLIATPEKIDLLLRVMPNFFDNIVQITFDEGHVLGNLSPRSSLMEMLITRLKNKLKGKVKFCFISAVMPNLSVEQIAEWLNVSKGNKITSVDESGDEWQPTRKIIGKFTWNGLSGRIEYPDLRISKTSVAFVPNVIEQNRYQIINPNTKRKNNIKFPDVTKKNETAAEIAYKYITDGPVLIFSAQTRNVLSIAKSLVLLIDLKELIGEDTQMLLKDSISIQISKRLLGEQSEVITFLQHGIGIHTGSIPQVVRKAIETDYRRGIIKILVCTNTLGQGVNLPIKTIVIHSMQLGKNHYIDDRDFWNIIGRSGRAGKETEGHIIYICKNQNDIDMFEHYRDKNNVGNVKSVFYQIIEALIDKRITLDLFNSYLSFLIEPQLLAILVEESINTPDENFIRNIINTSLFSIQTTALSNFDDSELVNSLVNMSENFYKSAPTEAIRKAFANTGFGLKSCLKLQEFINTEWNNIYRFLFECNDDFTDAFKLIISNLKTLDEMIPDNKSIEDICSNTDLFNSLIESWVSGVSISDIQKSYCNKSNFTYDNLTSLIEILFSYKYSWGITAFLLLLKDSLMTKNEVGINDLTTQERVALLDYLPSFIRFGTQDIYATWALSIGAPTRESAHVIAKKYRELFHDKKELKHFVKWFSRLTHNQISEWLSDHTNYEKTIILEVAQKINFRRYSEMENQKAIIFNIAGSKYYEESIKLMEIVNIGGIVTLARDPQNEYDQYAIKVFSKQGFLGYVPRDIAKIIAIRMDIDDQAYKGKIIRKRWVNNHWSIKVRVNPH